ncbi:MAG: hypothetical protein GDA46_02180 [Bdellovibrionales bacterium]|nr:hypothetical protein [Bdellovibrionales bacterium]
MSFSFFVGYQAGADDDLHRATFNCDLNALIEGINKGISIYKEDKYGRTPSSIVVEKLISLRSGYGTVSDVSLYEKCFEVYDYLQNLYEEDYFQERNSDRSCRSFLRNFLLRRRC